MEQAQIHLYCGDGKGKTTAAVGLAVRAAGAGRQVLFVQFMKGRRSSELAVLEKIPGIRVRLFANDFGFSWQLSEEQRKVLCRAHNVLLAGAAKEVRQGRIDLLVLDEALSAWNTGLLEREALLGLLDDQRQTEVVLTGRDPAPELVDRADYLTRMSAERHPYERGLAARRGIEY